MKKFKKAIGMTMAAVMALSMMGEAFSKVRVEFLKEGSKGEKKMDYSFYTVVRE